MMCPNGMDAAPRLHQQQGVPPEVQHGGGPRGAAAAIVAAAAAANAAPMMEVPRRQTVVDRLRKRIENYRKRQSECLPKHDRSFNGFCEQNLQDTMLLKQKFLETKAKRAAKKSEKKTEPSSAAAGSAPAGLPMGHLHSVSTHPRPDACRCAWLTGGCWTWHRRSFLHSFFSFGSVSFACFVFIFVLMRQAGVNF